MSETRIESLIKDRRVSVLNSRPPVLAAYDLDFERNVQAFAEFSKENSKTSILLQLGYEHETKELAVHLTGVISNFKEMAPKARVIVLCNSENECKVLGELGNEIRFIHQNCFLDERRYLPLKRKRIYDAAYIARLTPCKRHELIPKELSPRLLLMGTYVAYESEKHYSDMAHSRFPDARWITHFNAAKISEYLALAKCGLVLSAREGASFCSSEYFLCGLPVVDTPAIGGRSILYPEEYVEYVDSTPEAVGEGIKFWGDNPVDPNKIRKAWLEKARPHRAEYQKLMLELTGIEHAAFLHKLGIRTNHPEKIYSYAVKLYLTLRSCWG